MTILQDILAAVGWQTRVTENFRSVSPAGLYGINPATTTGLTFGYLGGEFNGVTVANGTVVLTASATNYVVAHRTTGVVTAATNTTNWLNASTYMQLFQFVAGATTFTIDATSDKRQAFGGVGGAGSFTGGTLTSALNEAPQVTLASATTVNIGAAAANSITVTGTTTITAFDTIAAGAKREVVFSGALTLTHNGTSLILPTGANITTAAGDVADFVSLGSGNWRCVNYLRANGQALATPGGGFTGGTLSSALNEAPQVALASGATVNIGAAAANTVTVSGTTTVTAFDSIATGAIRRVRFLGALTLTHNATSLILPGAANITTAAGDVATMESLGSGNWRCIDYAKADGTALVGGGGGGGLTNWTDAVNTASPNATVPVVSLTATNGATNVDAAISPKGAGALSAHVADGTSTGGGKRGPRAVDWQTQRTSSGQVASGNNSVIAGGQNNIASGNFSVIGGGAGNTASASNATVAGGISCQATANYATVGGGNANVAGGAYSTIGGGNTNSASVNFSTIGGGSNNTASGDYSGILGGSQATTRGLYGTWAWASGNFTSQGDAQEQHAVLRATTTNATTTGLSADGGTPAAATSVVLPNNSMYCFEATVSAKVATFGDRAAFKITGAISRGANAAATQIDGTLTVTPIAAIGGASAWTVTAVANTTLGSLEIRVTGVAATTIKWVAEVKTLQLVG